MGILPNLRAETCAMKSYGSRPNHDPWGVAAKRLLPTILFAAATHSVFSLPARAQNRDPQAVFERAEQVRRGDGVVDVRHERHRRLGPGNPLTDRGLTEERDAGRHALGDHLGELGDPRTPAGREVVGDHVDGAVGDRGDDVPPRPLGDAQLLALRRIQSARERVQRRTPDWPVGGGLDVAAPPRIDATAATAIVVIV